jgi:cyanate permease
MLVGALHDSAKSYTPGFIVLICLALVGAVIISFLPKQKLADS